MVRCKKCGSKTVLASGSVEIFTPDAEPYENGIEEDAETEEIWTYVDVGIHYCEKCGKINDTWIESPRDDEI